MDKTFTDLPLIGEPDGSGKLSTFCNTLRNESIPQRGQFIQFDGAAISLYLYGTTNTGYIPPHIYNKTMGMINSFVQQAAQYPPIVSLKPCVVTDGGPLIPTMAGEMVPLDGNTLCTWFQPIFDVVMYKRSRFDKMFRDVSLYSKLFGCQDVLCEYQADKKAFEFHVIPPLQWYKDPTQADINKAAYIGLDWPVDAEWAKRTYPQLAEQIGAAAQRSIYQANNAAGYSAIYNTQNYARPIVTMSFWWIRNREMPMTDHEAIRSGMLRSTQMEIPNADDDTSGIAGADAGDSGIAGAGEGSIEVDGTGEAGSMAQPPQYREALVDAQGNEVTPDSPAWPRKLVLSQTIQIQNTIVEDIECPYWDIPVVSGFNIQIPNRPYGQSACLTILTQQNDLNQVHSNIIEHSEYFKAPTSIGIKGIQEGLPQEMKNRHQLPGTTMWVDDAILGLCAGNLKNAIVTVDPPSMPAALITVRDGLIDSFNDAASRPDVAQGNAPTANASGTLAKTLLTASQANTEYTFLSLNDMAERLAMLVMHGILDNFTAEDLWAINRTFDPQTTQMLLDYARSYEWEIEIEGAWDKQQRESQIRADLMAGILDIETARDMLGYDHKAIMQRQMNQMASSAVGGAPDGESPQLNSGGGSQQPAGKSGSLKLRAAS